MRILASRKYYRSGGTEVDRFVSHSRHTPLCQGGLDRLDHRFVVSGVCIAISKVRSIRRMDSEIYLGFWELVDA